MKTIGGYRIRGLLGRGGMGKVYKVEVPVIGRILALKRLDPNPLLLDLMGAATLRKLFTAEAAAMAGLRHPHIVEIFDFKDDPEKPFYLMDYFCNNLGVMIGESYMPDAPSRTISLDKAVHYAEQTLSGLACLHHAGLVHRDIKPFNILVTDQDTVKISDFGLSKLRGEKFQGPSSLNVGSPFYAAPEQEENPDHAEAPADLYPVGVMLYRMLTGGLPDEDAPPASAVNPDLDAAWDEFLDRAMAEKPEDRFADAREMRAALLDLRAAWEERQENICRIAPEPAPEESAAVPLKAPLRTSPIKVSPADAPAVFSTDDLWRPDPYVANQFAAVSDDLVKDRATGLVWQRSGSAYPLDWPAARDYIDGLNAARFGGRDAWRLPTVNELMSLLSETRHGADFCIVPAFDRTQKWLWSCDRRSFIAAWYVSVELGFVAWQDVTAFYYARGVCGPE